MSELRKANTDHAYFITLTVAGWIDVFIREPYTDIIYANLNFCRDNKGLEISPGQSVPVRVALRPSMLAVSDCRINPNTISRLLHQFIRHVCIVFGTAMIILLGRKESSIVIQLSQNCNSSNSRKQVGFVLISYGTFASHGIANIAN